MDIPSGMQESEVGTREPEKTVHGPVSDKLGAQDTGLKVVDSSWSPTEVSGRLRSAFVSLCEPLLQNVETIIEREVERRLGELRNATVQQERDNSLVEIQTERKKVDRLREDLRCEQHELEQQRLNLRSLPGPQEVIHLNVGGETRCSVKRATLCVVESSLLCSMFSGRWDSTLERDRDNCVLIDFPPDLFMPLVDYLRQKNIEDPEDPVRPPEVPAERQPGFNRMVRYFGLWDAMWPCADTKWEAAWGPILVTEDGRMCSVATTGTSYFAAAYVDGMSILRFPDEAEGHTESYTWKLVVSKTMEEKPWCHDSIGFGLVNPEDERRIQAQVAAEMADPSPAHTVGATPRCTNVCRDLIVLTLYGGRADSRRTRAQGPVTPCSQDSIEVEVTLKAGQLSVSVDGSERGLVRPKPVRGPEPSSCRLLVAMTYDWNCVKLSHGSC